MWVCVCVSVGLTPALSLSLSFPPFFMSPSSTHTHTHTHARTHTHIRTYIHTYIHTYKARSSASLPAPASARHASVGTEDETEDSAWCLIEAMEEDKGDQFAAVKPWKGAIREPSTWNHATGILLALCVSPPAFAQTVIHTYI